MLLLTILLAMLSCVAGSLRQQISGQYGSDLHFPLSPLCQEQFFDIYGGGTRIGNFHDSFLQGFNSYNNRLHFDRENCTFTLKDFSEADAHNFTFVRFERKNSMDFEVHVPAVIDTPDEHTSDEHTSDGCTSGLFALGFSMDPFICLIFIIFAMTMKEKRWTHGETVVSHTQKVVAFFLGKQDRTWIKPACISIKVFSLVFQIISLISLACCGDIYKTNRFIAAAASFTVTEVFLTGVWIYFAWKCDGGNMNLVKKYLARCRCVMECAQSLAFPFCICFLYFSLYAANVTLWALIAFPLVLVILKIGIFILCCWKKRKSNTNEESKLDAGGPL
ncbi:uncharacterized protein LOC120924586 [Rana temporaria]|uniref:uncharacterized protein LOC120924586 n=1 Tax=Rana temporaria TaxID=8407 RepID=UPI001AACD81E|nr:uncharacterized protein LOC120924586 [Rana temporaria]